MNIGRVANNFFLVKDVVTVLLHEEEDLLKAMAPAFLRGFQGHFNSDPIALRAWSPPI